MCSSDLKTFGDERKRLKKLELEATSDVLAGVRDSLQAIIIYGKVENVKGVELTEDKTKLAELEMIFETRYQGWEKSALEKEAAELLVRYKAEMNKQEVEQLMAELEDLEEQEGEAAEVKAAEILRRIMELKRK